MLWEAAATSEELNKFWYTLYNSNEYLAIQDELIANTQSILDSVQPQIEAAQEELENNLTNIPEVEALINAGENYIDDLRNEFPALDSQYHRLKELELYLTQPDSTNTAPQYLQFDLEHNNNTLVLTNAWIHDGDGCQDVQWIDFWLQTAGASWIDVEDPNLSSIQPWSDDYNWGSFNHSINLRGYNSGNYTLWAQAVDSQGATSNIVQANFTIPQSNTNSAPQHLQFDLNLNGNTLTLQNAWIHDGDGSEDIEWIDFWLQTAGGSWIDVEDPTSIQIWSDDDRWASFNHSINLSGYNSGNYMLWAQAVDSQGATSNIVQTNFTIQQTNTNSPPQHLQFDLDRSAYQAGDILALENAWVYDADGSQDVQWIDFWFQWSDGEWIDIYDVTDIEAWSGDRNWGNFEYYIDLSGVPAGNYMVWAQAIDSQGNTSNSAGVYFDVLAGGQLPESASSMNQSDLLTGATQSSTDIAQEKDIYACVYSDLIDSTLMYESGTTETTLSLDCSDESYWVGSQSQISEAQEILATQNETIGMVNDLVSMTIDQDFSSF